MTGPEITYAESWRRPLWDDSVPSRPAWFVSCPEHPALGKDQDGIPRGYASSRIAQTVATRHARSKSHAIGAKP